MSESKRKLVVDVETTGLDLGHRIVEIAAVETIDGIMTKNIFHSYINPKRDMPAEAYRIHGISSEFLKDKPIFGDVAHEFLEFIGTSKLVIHNAQFDIRFINYELSLLNIKPLNIDIAIDTLPMARKKFPGLRVNLDALCRLYGIDNSNRKFHGALKDSYLLAEVYLELIGGRQNSFDLTENKNEMNKLVIMGHNKSNLRKTCLHKPNSVELEQHKEFLELLNKG